eukprot:TRINITY_DN18480_c0_g1_i1.p1 TRINITY_DN18480_c0_g1~~TRINITY_DN18480_c0_g1_i1.p1  ORF type:complete len:135 (+),score=26.04 TRINITY_DN18480_c0_g1_i1:43-447(+)
MKMNGPLFNGDKLNIPVTVVDQHCGGLMHQAYACGEEFGKGSEQCKGIEQATNNCIKMAVYNYVAIRKMCKREYSAWATCMDNAAEHNYSPEMADSECSVFRAPLDSCSEEIAEVAAVTAIERGIAPKDIPEQK